MKHFFISILTWSLILPSAVLQAQTVNFDGPFKPLPQINKEFLVLGQIVLDNLGNPGIDSATIVQQLNRLNTIFKPVNATFTLCGINYIKNYQYENIDDKNRDEIITKYYQHDRINLYYVNSYISGNDPWGFTELGGISGLQKSGVIVSKLIQDPSFNLAHAFGHLFNLYDTNENPGSEQVDGSNCATRGDQVCDTPADPYDDPKHLWESNCVFVDTNRRDAKGLYYEPDVSNIMSFYFDCICYRFTHGQYTRMAEYYLSHRRNW